MIVAVEKFVKNLSETLRIPGKHVYVDAKVMNTQEKVLFFSLPKNFTFDLLDAAGFVSKFKSETVTSDC